MIEGTDIQRYVEEPSLLVRLCRDVIAALDPGPDKAEVVEKEAQLREISRSMERLEKAGIAVPDVLRAEKTRLAAALGTGMKVSQALTLLADQFDEILSDLATRLGRSTKVLPAGGGRAKRSRSLNTGRIALREQIIQALMKLGGRAPSADVTEEIRLQLAPKMLPGDMTWRASARMPVWQNNVHWERLKMVKDGVLRSDSPRGVWELSERQR